MEFKHIVLSLIALVFIGSGCQHSEQNEWYDGKDWLGKTTIMPDSSIDKKELYIRYHKNPDRWKKAFSFLTNKKLLDTIQPGVHELDGQNVFVRVTAYNTKSSNELYYESHRDYTDIQYVVSGEEYIGSANKAELTVKTPYSAENDIEIYNGPDLQNHLATPGVFFIFFPNSPHRPSLLVTQSTPVKKIVIKVKN